MRQMIRRFCIGVGFAATVYLLIVTFGLQEMMPTALNTFSVLITGGLIGITTVVFDVVGKTLFTGLATHFAITTVIVYMMLLVNEWQFQWQTLAMIVIIYGLVWGILWLTQDNDGEQFSE